MVLVKMEHAGLIRNVEATTRKVGSTFEDDISLTPFGQDRVERNVGK
jgi:hypothetical protein